MANVKLLSEREKRHSFGSSNWGVIFHERVHKFGWLGNFVGMLISMVACVVQLSYKSFIDVETWGTSIHVTLHAFSLVDGYGLCPWGWIELQSLTLGSWSQVGDSKSSIINCFFLYLSFLFETIQGLMGDFGLGNKQMVYWVFLEWDDRLVFMMWATKLALRNYRPLTWTLFTS